ARLAVTASMSRPSDELRRLTDEADRIAEASGDVESRAYVMQARLPRFDLDELDHCRRIGQELVDLAEQHERPEWIVDAAVPLARGLATSGRFTEAAELLTVVADGHTASAAKRAQVGA